MNKIEFVRDVLETLRDMDDMNDVIDVICNLDAETVVERMEAEEWSLMRLTNM